jgi:hypothetical protein
VRGTSLIRMAGIALTVVVLGTAPTAVAHGAEKPPRELWSQYPLGKTRTAQTGTTSRGISEPARPSRATTSGRSTRSWLPGLVAALGLAGMATLVVVSIKREKGGTRVREFLHPHGRKDGHGGSLDGESPQSVAAASPEPDTVARTDLGDVGQHITSVLAAAEAAAAKLRSDAENEATEVREQAEQAAGDIRRRVRQEAETARASAQEIVAEAESTSADTRSEADRYAENRRREADAHAAKIVLEAEQRAASIADAAEERHREVLTNIATSEARLRDLAKSLRGVASALDTVVGDEDGEEPGLEESLRSRVRPGRPESEAVNP